jgi:type I restriction enzyme M protein
MNQTALKKRKQDLGIFYTPENVVDFIYDILKVLKEEEDKEKNRWESRKPKPHFPSVIDPACGEGIFLKKAIESGFTGHHPTFKVPYIFGIDVDETVVTKWAELSILSLFEGKTETMQKHFYGQNGLLDLPDHKLPYKKGEDGLFQFDAVVGNPPYGGIGVDFMGTLSEENQKLLESLEKYEIFGFRKNKKSKNNPNAGQMGMFELSDNQKAHISRNEIIKMAQGTPVEVLFIERFIQLAKIGGWIAVIIPDGILANSNMHYVRQFIAAKTKVLGIVSLPRNTFKHVGTSAKTSILFLQKQDEASNNGFDYNVFLASINDLQKSHFDQIVQSFNNFYNYDTI